MKSSLLSRSVVGLTLGLSCIAAQAADSQAWSSSASVTFSSNYLYRGVTQTSDTAAISGSLGVSHESGFYASLWSSSIDFANGQELDPAIGFSKSVGDVTYDVGGVYYGYPGATGADLPFAEAYASLSWMGAKLGGAWTDNYFGHTGPATYLYLSYGTELAGVSLSASVGNSMFDELEFGPDLTDSYVDYSLSVGKSFAGLDFAVTGAGSDLDKKECTSFSGASSRCDLEVTFSVSKSL